MYLNDKQIKRIKYATFLSNEKDYMYVETPKAACSTMKNIFFSLNNIEYKAIQTGWESTLSMSIHSRKKNNSQDLFSLTESTDIVDINKCLTELKSVFCVVRNPYARLASAWADKIRQCEPGYSEIWKRINLYKSKKLNECPSFSDFVDWIDEKVNLKTCNPHWRPMHDLLLIDVINYTDILKTETLSEDFQKVLNKIKIDNINAKDLLNSHTMNESLPINWVELYNPDLAEKVYNIYKKDFDIFGYSKDSWLQNNKKDLSNIQEMAIESIRKRNATIESLIKAKRIN